MSYATRSGVLQSKPLKEVTESASYQVHRPRVSHLLLNCRVRVVLTQLYPA